MSLRRLKKQLAKLQNYPSSICSVIQSQNPFKWKMALVGPENSPYEGGIFFIDIFFPKDYPFRQPKCIFVNRMYHPNINQKGYISIDLTWSPSLTVEKLMISFYKILQEPNPHDPLRPQVGNQYLNNYEKFVQMAKQETKKYSFEVFTK